MTTKSKPIHSNNIFQLLEQGAIKWGEQYRIANIGEIVTSKLGGVRDKKVEISNISVVIGRDASSTTQKTFAIHYVGRRLNAKGEYKDSLGCGVLLNEFVKENGQRYSANDFEITEHMNDTGLSFNLQVDPEAKKLYPKAFRSYFDKSDYKL